MPTGTPVTRAISSTNRIRPATSENAAWLLGLMQSFPGRTPRIFAISSVTLCPGRTPPFPGLAPWESLTSMARTVGAPASVSTSLSISAPCLWWGEMPPSPVLW